MTNKPTMVLGATTNRARYSNLAVRQLKAHGHKVIPIGIKEGEIDDIPIIVGKPPVDEVDTVTLYLNAKRQEEYYDYILKLKPKRIIFNPGAENDDLTRLARENGIEPIEACTLVMLSTDQY